MRKKLLLLLSLFVIAMTSVGGVNVSAVTDNQIALLIQLGICNDITAVEFEPEGTLAKKTFYTALYNIMTDEEESDEKIISYLGKYNIKIDEYSLRDNITREEALSATVSMLGYTYKSLSGDELLTAASQLGVRKYVDGDMDGDMTLEEFYNLLCGAIEAEMVTLKFNATPSGFSFEKIPDTTPLMYYKDIYYVRGNLNKNKYASIIDNVPTSKGYVQIDNEQMRVGTTNASDYIGMPVEAYVQYDEDEEGTICYIVPDESHLTVIKLDAKDIVDVDNRVTSIEYEIGDTVKTSQISDNVKVIFNGQNHGKYKREDLMPGIGEVELIDADSDRRIDVINVKSYQTMLVNYASKYNLTIKNKYNNLSSIVLDPDLCDVVIEKDGVAIDFSEIKPNDVLLVAQSKNADGVIRVIVSTTRENVFITGYTGEKDEIITNEKIYTLSYDYINETKAENSQIKLPEAGKNYEIYLDGFGNIAYAINRDGKVYIYARSVWQDENDEQYYIKAFNSENVWETYKWADNVTLKVDNDRAKDDDVVYGMLCPNNPETNIPEFTPQLLRVEFNSNGEIRYIETATAMQTADENKFTKYQMDVPRIYTNASMSFGCEIFGAADTKVFIVPTDKSDVNNYRATNMSYFALDKWYKVEGYDINKFYVSPMIVIETDAKSVGTAYYFVKEVREGLVNDEVRTIVSCYSNEGNIELVSASDYTMPNIKVGDVIQCAINLNGEITYAEVYKSVEKNISKTYPSLTDTTAIHKSNAFAAGYVMDIDAESGMMLADCGNSTPGRFKFRPDTKYYLYDGNEKNKVTEITAFDINPTDGVYVFIRYTEVRTVYVTRNVK